MGLPRETRSTGGCLEGISQELWSTLMVRSRYPWLRCTVTTPGRRRRRRPSSETVPSRFFPNPFQSISIHRPGSGGRRTSLPRRTHQAEWTAFQEDRDAWTVAPMRREIRLGDRLLSWLSRYPVTACFGDGVLVESSFGPGSPLSVHCGRRRCCCCPGLSEEVYHARLGPCKTRKL